LKALIFDLDGTLYEQAPLRRAVFLRLLGSHLGHPLRGFRTLRILQAYRRAQESMRRWEIHSVELARAQRELAAESLEVSAEAVEACVATWMEREPLPLLARSMRKGLPELLAQAKQNGMFLAVWSDYPADRKLAAMGIRDWFDIVVTAQDPAVGRFKPDPTGLELILARCGVAREEALYIGDRPEVDGLAARRAGVAYLNIGSGQSFQDLLELPMREVAA
jgi:HAD superfamily hydrolase (TIGR01549 family)